MHYAKIDHHMFVLRIYVFRTYHNTRTSNHSNIQWLLHDPAYTSGDIDKGVLQKLLNGLRAVSPYIRRLRMSNNNRWVL